MQKGIGPKRGELPIACNLSGQEEVRRREEVAGSVFVGVRQVEELADGYPFAFPGSAEWIDKLVSCVNSERACCPFFAFEIFFEPNLGPVWMKVRGVEGAKAFVKKELAAFGTN